MNIYIHTNACNCCMYKVQKLTWLPVFISTWICANKARTGVVCT